MNIKETISAKIEENSSFFDYTLINKIINKLTDYGEIITENKLKSFINYSFNLNTEEINAVIDFLLMIQAVSRIYNIATKGSQDLETEYISNILSDLSEPKKISSYVSLLNIIENRLTHQIQYYNMNMYKTNSSQSMPVSELKGHIKTYIDLSSNNVTVSSKAHHGFIAASLHDAYMTLLNKSDWENDRTYQKFFFNDDDASAEDRLLISKAQRFSLREIEKNIELTLEMLNDIKQEKISTKKSEIQEQIRRESAADENEDKPEQDDKLMQTPFARQYGSKIDTILNEIIENASRYPAGQEPPADLAERICGLYSMFRDLPESIENEEGEKIISDAIEYLLNQKYGAEGFTKNFLHTDKKIPFPRFYSSEKETAEKFINEIFRIYVKLKFRQLFRIIRSTDLQKYASVFSIKRIYSLRGDGLSPFDNYLIMTIAKTGKIKN